MGVEEEKGGFGEGRAWETTPSAKSVDSICWIALWNSGSNTCAQENAPARAL